MRLWLSISRIGYSVKRLKYAQNIAPILSAHRSRTVGPSAVKFVLLTRVTVSYERAKFGAGAVNSSGVTTAVID